MLHSDAVSIVLKNIVQSRFVFFLWMNFFFFFCFCFVMYYSVFLYVDLRVFISSNANVAVLYECIVYFKISSFCFFLLNFVVLVSFLTRAFSIMIKNICIHLASQCPRDGCGSIKLRTKRTNQVSKIWSKNTLILLKQIDTTGHSLFETLDRY